MLLLSSPRFIPLSTAEPAFIQSPDPPVLLQPGSKRRLMSEMIAGVDLMGEKDMVFGRLLAAGEMSTVSALCRKEKGAAS